MSERKKAPVWISRWVLSDGILTGYSDGLNVHVTIQGEPRQLGIGYFLREGRDFFETEYAAVANAQERQKRKAASLRKQLAKIEGKVFKVTT